MRHLLCVEIFFFPWVKCLLNSIFFNKNILIYCSTWAIIGITGTCLATGSRTLLASVSWSWTVACPRSCFYTAATRSRAHAPFLPFAPPPVHFESNKTMSCVTEAILCNGILRRRRDARQMSHSHLATQT